MYLIRFPYYARETHFSEADKTGARIADGNILDAALSLDEVEGIFVINDDVDSGLQKVSREQESSRVMDVTSSWLRKTIESGGKYLAIVSAIDFSKMALWRQHLSASVPICAIVHAIPYEHLASLYLASACMARHYDRVLVSSEAGSAAVVSIFKQCESILGASCSERALLSQRVHVVPLPVKYLQMPENTKSTARNLFEIPQDSVVFLSLGRLTSTYKADLEPMIRAFAAIQSPEKRHLVIAGHEVETGYLKRLRSLAKSCGVSSSVKFILNIPSYSKGFVYALADVFVAPSDNIQETFGLAVVEAMMSRLPVVATRWSGYRDLVIDRETGFLIDTWLDVEDKSTLSMIAAAGRGVQFEKAMADRTLFNVNQMISAFNILLSDKNLRGSLGAAGHARALKHFSVSTVLPVYQSLWREQVFQAQNSPSLRGMPFDFVRPFEGFPQAQGKLSDMRIEIPTTGNAGHADDENGKGDLPGNLHHRRVGDVFSEGKDERALAGMLFKKGIFRLYY